MTIDDELRPMPRGPSTTRDLERYAGGLPDTGAFPSSTLAAVMERIARESSAEALQYGPTEGLAGAKDCIVEVMAAEGIRADPDDMIVTAGGQQVIDLVARALIDPGDVIIA